MYNPGLGDVGAYLISGHPWVSGSGLTGSETNNGERVFSFPRVAKGFTVVNTGTSSVYIHFDSRANSNVITYRHFVELNSNEDSFGFYSRVIDVYISMKNTSDEGDVMVYAELTSIPRNEMHALSGSGINSDDSV